MTAKRLAEKQRRRQIIGVNDLKDGVDKLTVKIDGGVLSVDGAEYRKQIRPPSCREILKASKETRMQRCNAQIKCGDIITVENQKFIGYSSCVKSMEEVNLAYAKVKSIHTDARHVIAAVRIPGRAFHNLQDFNDDEEHAGGAFLLKLLTDSGIQNRAVFVARIYEGTHIGTKRYDAMRDAVVSAINKAQKNTVTGAMEQIWLLSKGMKGVPGVRGRPAVGYGRGGRGNGRGGGLGGSYGKDSHYQPQERNPWDLQQLKVPQDLQLNSNNIENEWANEKQD